MDDPDFWSKVVPISERTTAAPEQLGQRRCAKDAAESIKAQAQYSSETAIETAMGVIDDQTDHQWDTPIDDQWKVRRGMFSYRYILK